MGESVQVFRDCCACNVRWSKWGTMWNSNSIILGVFKKCDSSHGRKETQVEEIRGYTKTLQPWLWIDSTIMNFRILSLQLAKDIFPCSDLWKDLGPITNPVAVNTPSAQTAVLKSHFPIKQWVPWKKMADFRSGAREAWNIHQTRWQGSPQRLLGQCQKDSGVNLKSLPLAKGGHFQHQYR